MRNPNKLPPEPGAQSLAPGEMPRASGTQSWAVVVVLATAGAVALLFWSPGLQGVREEVRAAFADPPAPLPVPKPGAKAPAQPAAPKPQAAKPAAPPPPPAAPYDDRARPVSFYFARWGVNEAQSPIGWTSRIEIRPAAAGGGVVAKIWVTCPKGHCEAGEVSVNPVAHLQKKEMTAFLSMQRREPDRTWTLLLRPAPGRPDELERWEWYGPPGTDTKTQSVLGLVRRMRPDGTFH
jgi:hypothetical protein